MAPWRAGVPTTRAARVNSMLSLIAMALALLVPIAFALGVLLWLAET